MRALGCVNRFQHAARRDRALQNFDAERMQRSARRIALPELPTEDFVESLRALIAVDEPWVPPAGTGETSLYLRPFTFASGPFLGVRPANEATGEVRTRRGGDEAVGGLKPVTLWISQHYARARACVVL